MKKEITLEEYKKSCEIKQRFERQENRTVQVSITYDSKVSVTLYVPDDWSKEKVIQELKDNYYSFVKDDQEEVQLCGMTELILNGVEIDLSKK